jgi:hypothetical protein
LIWARRKDLLGGRRLMRVEILADQAGLRQRLNGLIPLLGLPPSPPA